MQQSDLGYFWYFLLDQLGFPRWVAENTTIGLACLSLLLIWYYCVKAVFILKVERDDYRSKH